MITTVIFTYKNVLQRKKSHSFLFAIKMESFKAAFVLFAVISMCLAVNTAPTEPESPCDQFDKCVERNEDFFDRWVCASNDHEMMGFSGTCRMHQHNCKNDESNYYIKKFYCSKNLIKIFFCRFLRS